MPAEGHFTTHARKLGLALPAAGVWLPWTWCVRAVHMGQWSLLGCKECYFSPLCAQAVLSPRTLALPTPLLVSVRRATVKLMSYPGKAGCRSTTSLPRAAPLGWELACAWRSAQHSSCSCPESLTQACAARQLSHSHSFTDKRKPRPGDMKSHGHDGAFRK